MHTPPSAPLCSSSLPIIAGTQRRLCIDVTTQCKHYQTRHATHNPHTSTRPTLLLCTATGPRQPNRCWLSQGECCPGRAERVRCRNHRHLDFIHRKTLAKRASGRRMLAKRACESSGAREAGTSAALPQVFCSERLLEIVVFARSPCHENPNTQISYCGTGPKAAEHRCCVGG